MRSRVATYKVLYVDGREREVIAQRMSMDHDYTIFEVCREGSWEKLDEVPSGDVDTVRRRVSEANSTFRWVTARSARQAHGCLPGRWR